MDTEVLIVGAGPVGLACSLLLSQLGVAHQVLERRPGLHTAPQAHVISARTMEVFRAAGLDEARLRAIAAPMQDIGAVRWSLTLAGPDVGVFQLATLARAQKMMSAGPTLPANISQNRLEALLLDEVRARGATVAFDTQWESAAQDAQGVTSTVRPTGGGEPQTVRSRYLLACDGAGSRIRRLSGIATVGDHDVQTYMNIHVKGDFRALVGDRPAVLYWILDPAASGTFIAHDIDASWVFMHPLDQPPETEARPDREAARRLIETALGTDQAFEIVSHDLWRMTAEVAERYRDRNIFLVGDAAHRFPPTGGMGLNTGVADAFNLAWKLAMVLRGAAGPALLDTYGQERVPIAEQISAASLTNYLKIAEVLEALDAPAEADAARLRDHTRQVAADPARRARVQVAVDNQAAHFDMTGLDVGQTYERGALAPDDAPVADRANPVTDYVASGRPGARLPHLWLQIDGARRSVLDLVDRAALTLVAGPEATAWDRVGALHGLPVRRIAADSCPPEALEAWLRACGIPAEGALLVRPDQHVAWRGARPVDDFGATLTTLLDLPRT